MRAVKFRVWDAIVGKMLTVVGLHFLPQDDFHPVAYDIWKDNRRVGYPTVGENIMQYTGLKDKNGKEIYEGDIVDLITPKDYYTKDSVNVDWNGRVHHKSTIVNFRYGGFCFVLGEAHFWLTDPWQRDNHDWKVTGNIYENPELIKEKS